MRKLSKKISMLMVLAMLVSLFSGVVSASAASVWSFYNKTADDSIVAYAKETYKMENDQFADFDLYKSDEIVDTDVYTVVYESSDEEVVWVDAKNGKLRAQKDAEIGATAEITAHITNKVTGAEADRSFTIEIVEAEVEEPAEVEYVIAPNFGEEAFVVGEKYDLAAVVTADGEEIEADVVFSIDGAAIEGAYAPAKAGEVTIVATVVIDGEEYTAEFTCEVIEVVATEIVEVKQKDARTVEIVFDAKIAQAEADKIELFQGTVNKNVYKKTAVAKDNVVTFTSYKDFANKSEWTFKYGESEITLVGSIGEVASVKVEGPATIYTKPVDGKTEFQLKIKYFDANGVEVKAGANSWIEWKFDSNIVAVYGDKITAVKANEFAEISGIYHSNDYKAGENGQYAEFTYNIAPYEIKVLESDAANIIGIASAKVGKAENAQITTLPANRYDYNLYVTFKLDNGKDKKASEVPTVRYETTDESKLIVDPMTGALIPLASNTVVKVIVSNLVDKELVPLGAVDVVIGANVVAADPSYTSYKSVANGDVQNVAEFEFKGKDNFGADATYAVNSVKALSMPGTNDKDALAAVAAKVAGVGSAKLTLAAKGMATGAYVFEAEVASTVAGDNQKWKKTFSVFVEDASDTVVKSVKLVPNKTEYNTTITKDTKVADIATVMGYKVIGYNAKGVAVEEITEGYTVTVKLNGNEVKNLALYQAVTGGAITVSGTSYKVIDNGTYVFEGSYKNAQGTEIKFAPVTVTVKGGQTAPAISFEKNDAEVVAATAKDSLTAALNACFKAPQDNDNVTYGAPYIASLKDDVKTTIENGCAAGTYVAHVANVTVTETYKASGISVSFKVAVGKNVTVTVK